MSEGEAKAAGLTRALIIGAALGTIPLVSAGCAVQPAAVTPPAAQPTALGPAAAQDERALCDQALRSGDPRVVEQLLRTFPASVCVPATLAALPPQTLAQISPAVLADLPEQVRERIPSQAAAHLRLPARQVAAPVAPRQGAYGWPVRARSY